MIILKVLVEIFVCQEILKKNIFFKNLNINLYYIPFNQHTHIKYSLNIFLSIYIPGGDVISLAGVSSGCPVTRIQNIN